MYYIHMAIVTGKLHALNILGGIYGTYLILWKTKSPYYPYIKINN